MLRRNKVWNPRIPPVCTYPRYEAQIGLTGESFGCTSKYETRIVWQDWLKLAGF